MNEPETLEKKVPEEATKKPSFWLKHLWDFIVIGAFSIAAAGLSIWVALPKPNQGHIAQISVAGMFLEELDLSLEPKEERVFTIQGAVT